MLSLSGVLLKKDGMKILKGFGIIMAFLAVGEVVSLLSGRFVPGSVAGMVLLFAALCLGIVKPDSIRTVANFLTDNMTIFFVPAFVGLIDQWGIIKLNLGAWLTILFITTIVVMISTGLLSELIIKLEERRAKR